jgi:hypothetical protein
MSGLTISAGNADGTVNQVQKSGGGIYNPGSSFILENCFIRRNFSLGNGAGIYNRGQGSIQVTNAGFLENISQGGLGGAIFNGAGSAPVVTNAIFARNRADYGAGIHNVGADLTITNSTMVGNIAFSSGGGLGNFANSRSTVTNSIFWANTCMACPQGKGGEFINSLSAVLFKNSDVECGINGCKSDGVPATDNGGNLSSNPVFLDINDPLGPDKEAGTEDDGLRLSQTSSVIDKGAAQNAPPEDISGIARPQDGNGDGIALVDLGAYEFFPESNQSIVGLFFVNDGGRFQSISSPVVLQGAQTVEDLRLASKSLFALTLRPKVPNRKELGDRFYTTLYLLDASNRPYGKGVKVWLYRVATEGKAYIYQTQRLVGDSVEGKPILLVDNPLLEGDSNPYAYAIYGLPGANFLARTPYSQF